MPYKGKWALRHCFSLVKFQCKHMPTLETKKKKNLLGFTVKKHFSSALRTTGSCLCPELLEVFYEVYNKGREVLGSPPMNLGGTKASPSLCREASCQKKKSKLGKDCTRGWCGGLGSENKKIRCWSNAAAAGPRRRPFGQGLAPEPQPQPLSPIQGTR